MFKAWIPCLDILVGELAGVREEFILEVLAVVLSLDHHADGV